MAATDQAPLWTLQTSSPAGPFQAFQPLMPFPSTTPVLTMSLPAIGWPKRHCSMRQLRTHLSLTGFGVIRDDLSPVPAGTALRQTSVGLAFLASRDSDAENLSHISNTYSFQTILGGHDNIFNANGEICYALAPDMSLYARAAYLQRHFKRFACGDLARNGNLSDAQFTIGIHRQLF